MSDESIQATAENLQADFLNATTTAERWKVLNRAIDWAVAASENADAYRRAASGEGCVARVPGIGRVVFQEGPVCRQPPRAEDHAWNVADEHVVTGAPDLSGAEAPMRKGYFGQ